MNALNGELVGPLEIEGIECRVWKEPYQPGQPPLYYGEVKLRDGRWSKTPRLQTRDQMIEDLEGAVACVKGAV